MPEKFGVHHLAALGPEVVAIADTVRRRRQELEARTESLLLQVEPSKRRELRAALAFRKSEIWNEELTVEEKRKGKCIMKLFPVSKKWGYEAITINKWHSLCLRACQELRALAEKYELEEVRPFFNGALYQGHKTTGAQSKLRRSEGVQLHHLDAVREHFAGRRLLPAIRSIDDLPPGDQEDYEMNKVGFLQRSPAARRKEEQHAALRCQKGTNNTFNGRLEELVRNFASSQVLVLKASTILRTALPNSLFAGVPDSSLWKHVIVPFRYGRSSPWHIAIQQCMDNKDIFILHIADAAPDLPQWFAEAEMPQPFIAKPITGTDSVTSLLHYIAAFLSAPLQFIDNLRENRSPDYSIAISSTHEKASEGTEAAMRMADGGSKEGSNLQHVPA